LFVAGFPLAQLCQQKVEKGPKANRQKCATTIGRCLFQVQPKSMQHKVSKICAASVAAAAAVA